VPIYDYLCSNCRHLVEVIHGIHDDGPRFCPSCGADGTMRKALSTPTVHFKGSGWAKKDRSSTSGTRTKAAAAGSSTDSGGSEAKSTAAETSSTSTDKPEPKED
jgi:putative FmdB family regulatory protein